jgi:hypothetical protein
MDLINKFWIFYTLLSFQALAIPKSAKSAESIGAAFDS